MIKASDLKTFLRNNGEPPGVEMEVVTIRTEQRQFSWGDGQSQIHDHSVDHGLCLRVLLGTRQGILTASSEEGIDLSCFVREAVDLAKASPEDPGRVLGRAHHLKPSPVPVDTTLFSKRSTEIFGELRDLENLVLKSDRRIKKVVRIKYEESKEDKELHNTLNLSDRLAFTSSGYLGEVLAEDQDQHEVAWNFQMFRTGDQVNPQQFVMNLADEAVRSLGGSPVPSGDYTTVVHPRVATQFLSLFAEALSAEAVQKRQSFLRNRLGEELAFKGLTMVDDPFLIHGLNSAHVDDEGTPHRTLTMVQNGVLEHLYYDLRSANKDGMDSTGHGIKETFGAPPSPQATNLSIVSGSESDERLLESDSRVFHLREVMGLHTCDPVTGEFSLGASGDMYAHGAFERPVRGVTVAGNLLEFFKNIQGVGKDVAWYGGFGSPCLLVKKMWFAGV